MGQKAKKSKKPRGGKHPNKRGYLTPAVNPKPMYHGATRQVLDIYELLLLWLGKSESRIDTRLVLARGYRGPGGCYDHYYDAVGYDHDADEWRQTVKQRRAQRKRDKRDEKLRNAADASDPKWVHNREERYRIDLLGTPYAMKRREGKLWVIQYFPGERNRELARRGLPCEGEPETVRVNGVDRLVSDGDRQVLTTTTPELCKKTGRPRRGGGAEITLRAERPTELKRQFAKYMAQGKDPAKWGINKARAARIGKPRKPLAEKPHVPTFEERLGEYFNIIPNRSLINVEWRVVAGHFQGTGDWFADPRPADTTIEIATF